MNRLIACKTAALLMSSAWLATVSLHGAADGDGFRPAEYCTVLLAPKLQEKLQLTVVQRVGAAMLEDLLMPRVKSLLSMSLNRETDRFLLRDNPASGERSMMSSLDYSGERLRDLLTPEQQAAFAKIFKSGAIAPIKAHFIGQIPVSGPVPFEIRYTKYGETVPDKSPVRETVTHEDGKTVTHTEINIEEHRGTGKILAQMKSVPDAIEVLGAKDSQVRGYGSLWLLKTASVEEANRARVLAALTPHLDEAGDTKLTRLRSGRKVHVEAFCRWADRSQSAKLQELARLPKEHRECSAAALKTLLRVDPDGAEAAVRARMDDFFLRTDTTRLLEGLKGDDSYPQPVVSKLLELLQGHRRAAPSRKPAAPPAHDPGNAAADDPASLVADLQSGDRTRTARAMMQLIRTKPAAPNPAVATALAKVLLESDSVPSRVNAAWALENWGTAESLPALEKAAADSHTMVQNRAKKTIAKLTGKTNPTK